MLYPNFDELVQLRSKAAQSKLTFKQKVKSSMTGDYLSTFSGQGMEFDEVRKYVIGDDIRKIDWRITARVGTPHIKLFKEDRQLDVLLCVDMNYTMRFGTRGTFKSVQAAYCAAILGWCANNNNDAVGAYLFGDLAEKEVFFRAKRSRHSLWKMLQTLSQPNESIGNGYIPLSEPVEFLHKNAKSGSLVFIISDFLNIDDKFQHQLSYLARRCQVILISVNDPADMDIPKAGNILFAANERQMLHISTDSEGGRKAYRDQWQENRSKLDEITANLGIKTIVIRTNQDVYYDLFLGLK